MKPGADQAKAYANANTARLYQSLSERGVVSYLATTQGDATGLDTWLAAGNDLYLNRTETNQFGTPKFKSIFQQMESACPPAVPFTAYANADILFDESLLETLAALRAWLAKGTSTKSVLAVGQRWNHVVEGRISASDVKRVKPNPFQTNAQDYFITTRGFFDWGQLPDFVIARLGYDNSLVDWAHHRGALVDATETLRALHQTVADGNWAGRGKHFPDREYNAQLPGVVWDHGKTTDAQYKTVRKGGGEVISVVVP